MNVSDIMTPAAVIDSADDTLSEASAKMREQQTGSLLVMDSERLIGIFTERDLLKTVALGQDPKAVRLKDVMTTDVVTVASSASLTEAASMMASNWIRHLPVVDGESVVGVISQRDLIGVFGEAPSAPGELVRARRLKRIEAGDLD